MKNFIREKEKAFLYCRVSSEDKNRYSIDFQKKEAINYAREHNLQIVGSYFYVERAFGGGGRKTFPNMLEYVSNSSNIKHIIFYSQEILSKNFAYNQKIQELVEKKGKTIHFVKSNEIYNKVSFYNYKLMNNFRDCFVETFSDIVSKKTRTELQQKIGYGLYLPIVPFGYINNKLTKTIDVDKVTAPKIKKIFELLAEGYLSKEDLEKIAMKLELKKSSLYRIIRNPFYYGDFLFDGNVYHGKHIPLITKEVWNKANKELTKEIFKTKSEKEVIE